MTTFKRTFMLVSGLMACLIGSLVAIEYHYGGEGLVIVISWFLALGLVLGVCAVAAACLTGHL
jgi:hypothetical protein